MTLNLKYISLINLKGIPFFSDISTRIDKFDSYITEKIPNASELGDEDLVILCINELYGYRTGIIGYLCNLLAKQLTKINNPTMIQKFLNNTLFNEHNLVSNDYEIFLMIFTLLNRMIPIVNMPLSDNKSKILNNNDILKYFNNDSIPSFINLSSIFLLRPLFDNGCAVFSNKKPYKHGFERLETISSNLFDDLCNRGISWSYYKSENKGITIITFDLSDNNELAIKNSEIFQIYSLANKLKELFTSEFNLTEYETYIMGDFKIQLTENIIQMFTCVNYDFTNNHNNTYTFYTKNINITNENFMNETNNDISPNPFVYMSINKENTFKEVVEDTVKEVIENTVKLNEIVIEKTTENIVFSQKLDNYFDNKIEDDLGDEWQKVES